MKEDIYFHLIEIIHKCSRKDLAGQEISPSSSLSDLGIDAVSFQSFAALIDREFKVWLLLEDHHPQTVQEVIDYIYARTRWFRPKTESH